MKTLWEKLRSAAVDVDTGEMARLIVQLLTATVGSDARFRPFHELIEQHKARFVALGNDVDTVPMSDIIGILCRALFSIRHAGQSMTDCEELILILKRASNDVDTMVMARTFERLFHLCESESHTAKNQINLENIGRARERVVTAIGRASWDAVGASLADMLWSLAEARPDFEELPSLVAEAKESGVFDRHADRGVTVSEKVHSILESVVKRYGDESDRSLIAQMKCGLLRGRSGIPSDELALFSSDIAVRAVRFCKGVQRLPLSVQNDALHFGRHARISFHRTLRIPEDGRDYPLPAGFGSLPIVRVEDYAERVPEKWLEQGGFIIPLYQREALFLEFAGVKWHPTIAKVSVGRVNAISGKEHDLKIRPHRQDYVVIPDQRWLDGINSGDGTVNQFVAMPLGQGYTIEAQVSDEEKHGGFQLAIFDPRNGRFQDQDPKEKEAAIAARNHRALRAEAEVAKETDFTASFPKEKRQQFFDLADAMAKDGIATPEKVAAFLDELAPEGAGRKYSQALWAILAAAGHVEHDAPEWKKIYDRIDKKPELWDGVIKSQAPRTDGETPKARGPGILCAAEPKADEMGIAAGGRIKQQIHEDSYGAESWDEAIFRDVVIHIVNSEAYERITGLPVPPSPITADHYARHKIPWYSDYEEKVPSVAPAGIFKRILSIGQIDKNRGVASEEPLPKREINPEEIVRIRTPTVDERFRALVQRAHLSSQNQQYKIAVREASLALNLFTEYAVPFQIRAHAHLCLGNALDAEADASACLKIDPNNFQALSVRTMASFHLGEYLLARNDAEKVLALDPNAEDALFVREQATLELSKSRLP